jgi:hypothetical protein
MYKQKTSQQKNFTLVKLTSAINVSRSSSQLTPPPQIVFTYLRHKIMQFIHGFHNCNTHHLKLTTRSFSAKATFHKALLYYCRHDGLPCNGIPDDTLFFVFSNNIHIYSPPTPPKRYTISNLIWYCTSCSAPVAACKWSHLAVGTTDTCSTETHS